LYDVPEFLEDHAVRSEDVRTDPDWPTTTKILSLFVQRRWQPDLTSDPFSFMESVSPECIQVWSWGSIKL